MSQAKPSIEAPKTNMMTSITSPVGGLNMSQNMSFSFTVDEEAKFDLTVLAANKCTLAEAKKIDYDPIENSIIISNQAVLRVYTSLIKL